MPGVKSESNKNKNTEQFSHQQGYVTVNMFLRTLCVGHYVFLETSRPLNPRDKARLISPYIGLKVACLKFWYHSFGDNAHMGELQLIIKSDTVSIILNAQMTYMW